MDVFFKTLKVVEQTTKWIIINGRMWVMAFIDVWQLLDVLLTVFWRWLATLPCSIENFSDDVDFLGNIFQVVTVSHV